jgi:3-methylfumaryl-CoA hydratase
VSHPVTTAALDTETLQRWLGKAQSRTDVIDARPVALLSATLDRDDPEPRNGDVLPPLWHWLYFLPAYRQSEVGPDGHAKRGGFLPPVPLPRRMWAGSRIEWRRPLAIGDQVSRESRIVSVTPKHGRSGALVFVVVRHEIANAAGLALVEEHDIVYRELRSPGAGSSAPGAGSPAAAAWTRRVVPDDVLLFRYSALTFNSHRIHYDRRYATQEEGYPGLVVHGPLLATLLVDLLRRNRPGVALKRFEFRALAPLFDIAPFDVCGRLESEDSFELWAQGIGGAPAMRATATLV